MNDAALEARVQKLEDIEAIKDLMARHARYVDKGYGVKAVEVDKLPEIFANDIEWEVFGRNPGGAGLENEVAEATAGSEFTMHIYTNPVITVDGDDAKGNWLLRVVGRGGDAV